MRSILISALILVLFLVFPFTGKSQDIQKLEDSLATLSNPKEQVLVLLQLGKLSRDQRSYADAAKYYLQTRRILERNGAPDDQMALVNDEIGFLYQDWKGYTKSVEYFQEAIPYKARLGDTLGMINSLQHAAWSYYQTKDTSNVNKALKLYEQVLTLEKDSQAKTETLNRLAVLSELNQQIPRALEYSRQNLELQRSINNEEGEIIALNNLGYLSREMDKPSESLKYFKEAIDKSTGLLARVKDPEKKATIFTNIGVVYTNQRRFSDAQSYYERALKLRQQIADPGPVGDALNRLAANHYLESNYEVAKTRANEAIEEARKVNDIEVLRDSYRILADIYRAEGDFARYDYNRDLADELDRQLEEETNQAELRLVRRRSTIEELESRIESSFLQDELAQERAERLQREKTLAEERAKRAEQERQLVLVRAEQLERERELARTRALNAERERQLAEERSKTLAEKARSDSLAKVNAEENAKQAELAKENAELARQNAEKDALNANLLADEERVRRENERRVFIYSAVIGFLLLITIFILFFFYKNRQKNLKLQAQNKQIQEQNDQLEEQKNEISKQRDDLIELNEEINLQKEEIAAQRDAIEIEQRKSDELLLNILPRETALELKEKGIATPKSYEMVSVLFTDFKGFTNIASLLRPEDVVKELDYCFQSFDEIIARHGLEKIKTIGDAYMCAGGIPVANQSNPHDAVRAGLEIQDFMNRLREEKIARGEPTWEIRLGINSGPIVAGVIGKIKFAYDIWGDTVNVASRMESSGEVGKVNISGFTYELVKDHFECVYRGKIPAKNKGDVDMYFVQKALG